MIYTHAEKMFIKCAIMSGADDVIPNAQQLISYTQNQVLSGSNVFKMRLLNLYNGSIDLNEGQQKRYEKIIA